MFRKRASLSDLLQKSTTKGRTVETSEERRTSTETKGDDMNTIENENIADNSHETSNNNVSDTIDKSILQQKETESTPILEQNLSDELTKAKEELRLAAEIGQQLLQSANEKAEQVSALKKSLKDMEEANAKLADRLDQQFEQEKSNQQAFEDVSSEVDILRTRNHTLSAKLEASNREALRSSSALAELEAGFQTVSLERDLNAQRVKELLAQVKQLQAEVPLGQRSRQGSTASWLSAPPSPMTLSKRRNNLASICKTPSRDSESDLEDQTHFQTPKPLSNRIQEELEQARAEKQTDKRRIEELEKALEQTTEEQLQSTRKLHHLEQHLDEYQELIAAQSSLACSYKDRLDGEFEKDESTSLETDLLREELAILKAKRQSSNIAASIEENNLEESIDDMLSFENRFLIEELEREGQELLEDGAKSTTTADAATQNDSFLPDFIPNIHESDGNMTRYIDPKSPVERDGHSGPLLVKIATRSFFWKTKKWKPRVVELRGPRLLFFRNEWDVKPCKIVPIDGCEVRCVRRPHRNQIQDNDFADEDFNLDLAQIKKSGGRMEGRKSSFSTIFFGPSHASHVKVSFERSARVLHEFHLWHPRRPVVYFSAPNHQELSQWAEQIQRASTKETAKPKRFAAGYITLVEDGKNHLARFFAVLRTDGLHLYRHPRHRTSEMVVLLDNQAKVWKPTTCRKASKLLDDIGRTVCIQTTEQGIHSFMADTNVDCDWWVNTLKAHVMGVVSWGSVSGLKDDEPFGCLNV